MSTILAIPSKNLNIQTPEQLTDALGELLAEGRLPLLGNAISKARVETVLSFVHGSLRGHTNKPEYIEWKNACDDFERDLLKKEGNIEVINYEYGRPTKLKKLLDRWRKEENWGEIPLVDHGGDRKGKLGHLSKELLKDKYGFAAEFTSNKKWKFIVGMLQEFNDEMYEKGAVGTSWERKVPTYRKILEDLDHNKNLPLNQKAELNQHRFMVQYCGVADNISIDLLCRRGPKLKELFGEFNQRLKDRGVTAFKSDALIEGVKEILDKKDYILGKDKRLINRADLAKKLSSDASIIQSNKKLLELIKAEESSIFAGYKKGKTKKSFNVYGTSHINIGACPYSKKHDRVFDFRELVEIYDLEFSEKVGTIFIAIIKDKASPKPYYYTIIEFLKFIYKNENKVKEIGNVFSNLLSGNKIDQADFDFTCLKFKAQEVNNSSIACTVITHYGKVKLFPYYLFKTDNKARGKRKDRGNRPSLAEAKPKDVKFIESALGNAAKSRGIEYSLTEKSSKEFVLNLIKERDSRSDLPEDLVECILEISKERLNELRKVASNAFVEWQSNNEEGKKLIEQSLVNKDELISEFHTYLENKSKNNWFNEKYFAKDDPQALTNLLLLIKYARNSISPRANDDGQFWRAKYSRFGGVAVVTSYLNPTQRAVTSALMLYFCDSGANVSVGLILTLDRIEKSNIPNHTKITGNKARSKGKNIFNDIPNKSDIDGVLTGAIALKYLAESVRRSFVDADEKKQPISSYMNSGASYNGISEYNLRSEFKNICKESEYLSQYNLTPSMIRPTILLKSQLENPTNAGLIQVMANHEDETTTLVGYTNRLPYRVQMERHLTEYQDALEAILLMKSDNKNKPMGEADKQLENAQKTGLGVFCKDRKIIDKDGDEKNCAEVQDCIKCKQGRMLVIAEVESICDMVIWQRALEKWEKDWEINKPERWAKIWIPWKAFFQVVLEEKMIRGKLSRVKKDAIKLAETKIKETNFKMPEPW